MDSREQVDTVKHVAQKWDFSFPSFISYSRAMKVFLKRYDMDVMAQELVGEALAKTPWAVICFSGRLSDW